jgi:hypothetical protein
VGGDSVNDSNKSIEVLAFFEGRTLTRTFKVDDGDAADLANEIHAMADALKG